MSDINPSDSANESVPEAPIDNGDPSANQILPTGFNAQPAEQFTPPAPKRGGKRKLIASVIIIIVIAAVAAYVAFKPSHKQPAIAKKDIPVLTYGVVNDGNVPDYPTNTIGSVFSVEVNAQLFEGLVGYENGTKIVPLLATSWYNPNNTTWVFNLRHGVKFHSGRTMTAQDVKYTLDYAIAHQNDNDGASVLSLASTFKEVDVTGPYQVKVITNSPDPVLLSRLSLLGILDSKAKLGDYDAGTGPYVLKPGTTPNTTSIDLVASSNYWGGHVSTRELKIRVYNSGNQLLSDAKAGKLDLAGEFNTQQIVEARPVQKLSITDEGTDYIQLNVERTGSPLESVQAREAIGYALNIPAILKAGDLSGTQASQLVPLQLPGYNPSVSSTSYDPSKAKQLLGSVSSASQPLTFAYLTSDSPQMQEVTKELEAVGFTIKPVQVDSLDTLVNNATAGDYDLASFGYSSSFQDGQDILSGVLEDNQEYNNPQIDSLLTQAGNTLDQAQRIQDMQKIASIVNTDKPIVPLYTVNRLYALEKPYVVKSDMPGMVTGIYFWKVYQK